MPVMTAATAKYSTVQIASDDRMPIGTSRCGRLASSECVEMDLNILGPVSGRLGRYPSGARGQPSWHGIVADTNMPTEMTPWQNFMENLPPDVGINTYFRQHASQTAELPVSDVGILANLDTPEDYGRLTETESGEHHRSG